MSIQINISKDLATPALTDKLLKLRGDGWRKAMGLAVRNRVQEHLESLPPNKQFPSATTNFWKRASRATNFQVEGEVVAVNINQIGVRQRYYGGTIKPVHAKFLTIPARAEAYGKRAREFNNLHFAVIPGMGPALVESNSQKLFYGKKRKDGTKKLNAVGLEQGGGVVYWLRRQVTQRADPSVIPTDAVITETAVGAVTAFLRRREPINPGTVNREP